MATTETTTAAPNTTTLPGEVSGVIPDTKTSTTGPAPVTEAAAEKTTADESVPTKDADVAAPTAAAVAEPTKEPEKTEKVEEKKSTPIEELWAAAQGQGHGEIWGVTLADPAVHVPTQVVLQKYLNANDGDVTKAKDQLTKTLEWRAKMKPLELLQKKFNAAKFAGLGYVTTYGGEDAGPEGKEVFTWNIYGSAKNINETFGNLEEFLEWRVALMEEALQSLNLSAATSPITAEDDPYKIIQVHDYKSISFLRQSPAVKTASTETIKVFAQNYPELLKEKFFVNVPAFMGFIYALMKLFVAPKTIKKFHPMSNGANLARELTASSKVKSLGDLLPKEYGGTGADLNAAGKQPSLEEEKGKEPASAST